MEDRQQDVLRGAENPSLRTRAADSGTYPMDWQQKIVSRLKKRLSSFWLLQLFGWAAYGLMIYITFLPVLSAEGSPLRLLHIKLVRAGIGFSLTSILHYVYKRCRARALGFGSIAVVSVLCSALFGYLWVVCANFYLWLIDPASFRLEKSLAGAPREALDYSSIILAWSALYFGIKYWQDWQRERERTLKASALAHQAQLDLLRYQLNPHFLFNALNSLRASIDEDPARAKRLVTEFSEFLRYTLLNGSAQKEEVTLREEIEAVRNYLAIEKIRFEDKLQVAFDVEPSAEEFRLPGFLIHPLVENAVKHGMQPGQTPLVIRLTARRSPDGSLHVEVANTGRWSECVTDSAHTNGTGIGLQNVRRRLEQHFPGQNSFDIREQDGWIHAHINIGRAAP
jgi:two-component system LytT family sensor kinase